MILSPLDLILAAAFFAAAVLYAAVGHGGASSYLAIMGLFAVPVYIMRPTALLMNIAVASLVIWRFSTREPFRWDLFLPFIVSSIPCAYLGGQTTLPIHWHKTLVGLVLIFAAWRIWKANKESNITNELIPLPSWPVTFLLGAGIGLLSGLVGVGGGIFLSPIIVLKRWASIRQAAAPTAAFIWVNSIAGLIGFYSQSILFPTALPLWLAAVMGGGWIGAALGSSTGKQTWLRQALILVLVLAGLKMFLV